MNQAEAIPSRIEPRLVPRIWGRRRLDPLYEADGDLPEPIGEAWLSGEECLFADGPFAGRALGPAWREMPPPWKGSRLARETDPGFPILAKFLFPESALSVQVHPGDAYAARHETGGRGKTEMWYAVAAEPGAEVRVGFQARMSREALRSAVADGTILDRLGHTPLSRGDAVFLPAGTVHTIAGGVLLCEIQQYSDLTYRLFDYNRTDANGNRRELHVEKALDVIELGASPAGKTRPVTRRRGPVEVTYLAACRHFAAERWRLDRPVEPPASRDHFDLLVFLEGEGRLTTAGNCREYRRGESWLVPAETAGYRIEPAAETIILRAYVPDLAALEHGLAAEGVSRGEMAGFVFE